MNALKLTLFSRFSFDSVLNASIIQKISFESLFNIYSFEFLYLRNSRSEKTRSVFLDGFHHRFCLLYLILKSNRTDQGKSMGKLVNHYNGMY